MCIASKPIATMSTLQAVAAIPAFRAGSMLVFRRWNDVIVGFEGIGICFCN
jgi:hypothetical protein